MNILISFDDGHRADDVNIVRSNHEGYVVVVEAWKTNIFKVVVLAADVVQIFELCCIQVEVLFD